MINDRIIETAEWVPYKEIKKSFEYLNLYTTFILKK